MKGSLSDDRLSSDDTSDQSPSPSHDDGGHVVLSPLRERMLAGSSIFHTVDALCERLTVCGDQDLTRFQIQKHKCLQLYLSFY